MPAKTARFSLSPSRFHLRDFCLTSSEHPAARSGKWELEAGSGQREAGAKYQQYAFHFHKEEISCQLYGRESFSPGFLLSGKREAGSWKLFLAGSRQQEAGSFKDL
jgi:hypothetical protein